MTLVSTEVHSGTLMTLYARYRVDFGSGASYPQDLQLGRLLGPSTVLVAPTSNATETKTATQQRKVEKERARQRLVLKSTDTVTKSEARQHKVEKEKGATGRRSMNILGRMADRNRTTAE